MATGRSRVQLDISGVRAATELDIELNLGREIPYLRAPKYCSLWTFILISCECIFWVLLCINDGFVSVFMILCEDS